METTISRFYGTLSSFLSHIQTASSALTDSVRRRPIPLESVTASFAQKLGQKVSAAASDLELLENMAMGTVSVAELLGHMSEVCKRNQDHVDLLQDRLSSLGYVPDHVDLLQDRLSSLEIDSDGVDDSESAFDVKSSGSFLNGDSLFEDSGSLLDIGLSDACLATLACEDKYDLSSLHGHQESLSNYGNGKKTDEEASYHSFMELSGSKDALTIRARIEILRNDYDKLPSYMKNLATWEDLQEVVTKINVGIIDKLESTSHNSFKEADIEDFSLGRKGKSCILALLKMNKLVVDTEGGSVMYRIV